MKLHIRSGNHVRRAFASRRGSALLISLCAVVLLTGIVLAFFSRAQLNRQIASSTTNYFRAEVFARSAGEDLIGELRREIVDNSDVLYGDPEHPNPTYPAVYKSRPGTSPSPEKIGVDAPDTLGARTICKVSTAGKGMRQASSVVGSNVSIDTPSANGRKVSASAWFTASGPKMGSQTTLPTWVYLTRSGAKTPALTSALNRQSTDYVIGRYAYTIYDTSGLLDANVVGYPTAASALSADKSCMAYADMTALETAGTITAAKVNDFVTWRNGTSAASSTAWADFLTTFAEPYGFLYAKQGHQAFLSRRDLLKASTVSILPASANYFTHFARSVNAPSWTPLINATEEGGSGTEYAYRTNAEKSEVSGNPVANRNVENVRHTAAASIRHYSDKGEKEEYDVAEGDPIVKGRFSLGKLAWVGYDGPNTAAFASTVTSAQRDQAIMDCFGLRWNNAYSRWDYDHGNPGRILALGEIDGREPDFFELLKAGILSGSLGNQPGSVSLSSSGVTVGPAGLYFEYVSASKDHQILQIGANIIDQADADNYPTAIYQNLIPMPAYGLNQLYNTVFGQENLPMLQRITQVTYKTDADDTTVGESDTWLNPEVWNMHESSTADPTKFPLTPSKLRMVTYGGCMLRQYEDNTALGQKKTRERIGTTTIDFGTDQLNPKIDGIVSFVNPYFKYTSKGAVVKPTPFFDTPAILQGWGNTTEDNYEDLTEPSGPRNFLFYRKPPTTKTTARLLGVWLGSIPRDPRTGPEGYPTHYVEVLPISSPGEPQLTFVLEYKDNNGKWHPYSMMARVQEIWGPTFGYKEPTGWVNWFRDWSAAKPDPRTDRFSAAAGRLNSSGTTYNNMWAGNSTIQGGPRTISSQSFGHGSTSYLMPNTTAGFTYQSPVVNSFSTAYLLDDWARNIAVKDGKPRFWYSDPDGIVRPGDSWRGDLATSEASYGSGDGMLLYHTDLDATTYASTVYSKYRRRPIIMNRPYSSVGELGYVFRDQPFRTLDFWSDKSADSGLLDLFSVNDTLPGGVQGGKINLNAAPVNVIKSILKGGNKQATTTALPPKATAPSSLPTTITDAEAEATANGIVNDISAKGSISNRAELGRRLTLPIFNDYNTAGSTAAEKPNRNKSYGEAPMRTLVNQMDTRTWNVLVDVVAQCGKLSPNADGLEDFVVEGERRYWLHVAIDRNTGKVIDRQLEVVNE
ncbi:MAG: hypothetical protein ACAI35_14400 [Candidatus Methylacidiphilales bacterium]